jgi:hypothetical protein
MQPVGPWSCVDSFLFDRQRPLRNQTFNDALAFLVAGPESFVYKQKQACSQVPVEAPRQVIFVGYV